jgi:hypothetical protein
MVAVDTNAVINPHIPVGGCETFTPPHPIADRVRLLPGTAEDMLRDADRLVEALAGEFAAQAIVDCERARAEVAAAWHDPARRDAALRSLYRVAHDLKGQGTTFDYPLVSRIGAALCDYLRNVPEERRTADAIDALIAAVTLVLRREIKGDGGAAGADIAAALHDLGVRLAAARGA